MQALWAYGRLRLVGACGLLIGAGLTEGSGLLLLVPLLQALGLTADGSAPTGLSHVVGQGLRALGLPQTLPTILGLYVVLATAHTGLLRWCELRMQEIQLGFVDHLRLRLYTALGRANWQFLSQQRLSDFTASLTTDMGRLSRGTQACLDGLVAGCLLLVHIVVACRLSVVMTSLALGIGALLAGCLWPQMRRSRELGGLLTQANQAMFHAVSDFLDGLKLAKSYGAEERYRDTFALSILTLRQQVLHFLRSNTLVRLLSHIGATLALSLLVYTATTVVHLPTADLLVLVFIFARLMPILSRVQSSAQQVLHMLPSFANAMQLETRCATAAEAQGASEAWQPQLQHEVRFQAVSFRYDPQSPRAVLTDIALAIPARQTTALVGPSGAGKSTLADLLLGLLLPDAGTLSVDGAPLTPARIPLWRRHVAYVPQETFLFNDTVRANVLWAQPAAADDALWQALHLAAAETFVRQLPHGLDTMLGDRGVRLSGGERQRLALARALLTHPLLLILDEATSALDAEHERQIQQALEELHGALTIVIIAHRLSTVQHADHLIVLDQGRVVETGVWRDLSTRPGGRFQALLQAATGVDIVAPA